MTPLEDCYFCGTVEESLDSYPVIPPETYPPEDTQRTVVLCPTCREKLGRVLDPVVEYLGTPTPGQDFDTSTSDEERGGGDEIGETGDGGDEIGGAGDGEAEADALGHRTDDGAHAQRTDETREQVEDEQREQVGDEHNEQAEDEGEERDREDKPNTESGTDTRGRSAELPDGTRKIVRLLRNREFPVERGDVVTVAANAYEIRREEAKAAIDALVEHGWLIERDGELRRAG